MLVLLLSLSTMAVMGFGYFCAWCAGLGDGWREMLVYVMTVSWLGFVLWALISASPHG
jgi:hypothetical protein